ncbi:unnamed protein product, partial [Pylaiella littoralis]
AYGLVFKLSNGSVGLLFKDDTKMVLDPSGTMFDYNDSSSCPDHEAEQTSKGGSAPGKPEASPSTTPSQQYKSDYFPHYLKKKLGICQYFRTHLLTGGEGPGAGENGSEEPVDE